MSIKKISALLVALLIATTAMANDVQKEIELLKQQLIEINKKLLILEQQSKSQGTLSAPKAKQINSLPNTSKTFKSQRDIKLYASLRPTFGYIDEQSNKAWDVRDALSNAGFKSTYNFKEGWQATLHGEWGIDLSNNADFGKARQVYVALDSPLGKVGIGKQRPVQYLFIAEYIDIFNHSRSPFAYDPESPFFVNNLITYQKKINDFTFMLAGQFDGESGNDNEDFFNGGLSYDADNLHLAVAYSSRDIFEDDDLHIGEDKSYAASVAYTFENDWYVALGYQDVDYQRDLLIDRSGHTFDVSVAYPLSDEFKVKAGLFDFEDGYTNTQTQDHSGANLTFEWLPVDSLRFHIEYLRRDFEQFPDFNSISVGFRYDFAQTWQF